MRLALQREKNAMRTITGDVWSDTEVVSLACKAKVRLYCVAYVTQTSHGLFRAGDILVCDSSRKAVACGETNPVFLKSLIKMGVQVYSCEALHAKCAVWDDAVLMGSANMSESSSSRLVELSVLERNQSLADQVAYFIMHLIEDGAAEKLSLEALQNLAKIWATERRPWQAGLQRRKAARAPLKAHKGHFCRFVTVRIRDNGLRGVTDEDIAQSEAKASAKVEESSVSLRSRKVDWYCTRDKEISRKLRTGDSIIVVEYPSSKATRANVFGPCTVVLVDRCRGRHFVHYVKPLKSMPYRQFADHHRVRSAAGFRFGKNIDRRIDEQAFAVCSGVLKKCAK